VESLLDGEEREEGAQEVVRVAVKEVCGADVTGVKAGEERTVSWATTCHNSNMSEPCFPE